MNDEYLQLESHIYSKYIKESLDIVQNYIRTNNLILVGGEAINVALKTKGGCIYDKYTVADYDAISPDFYTHAKNIAEILCKKKFPEVAAITAIHNTTVRVKVSSYTVFDSTYCPESIFNEIHTLKYLGLNIIHPNHQKIDQYNSLSFLFEQTGASQNIYHRLEKDIERNKLLNKYFPINVTNFKHIKFTKIKLHKSLLINNDFKKFDDGVYIESDGDICTHGFLAYSLYYQTMIDLYEKHKSILSKDDNSEVNKLLEECVSSEFTIKSDICEFTIPENENITLINGNDNIKSVVENINKKYKILKSNTYNNLLGIKPITQIHNTVDCNFELFDLSGKLLSCNLFIVDNNNIIASNYNYILSYFLMKYYYYHTDEYYLAYYISLKNIVEIVKIFDKYDVGLTENFNYSISTYGKFNYPESHYYFINNFDYMMLNNKNSDIKPKKLYPKYPECKVNKQFDETQSIFFNIDGKINNDMKYTNYLNLLE